MIESNVINHSAENEHRIEPYRFKVIASEHGNGGAGGSNLNGGFAGGNMAGAMAGLNGGGSNLTNAANLSGENTAAGAANLENGENSSNLNGNSSPNLENSSNLEPNLSAANAGINAGANGGINTNSNLNNLSPANAINAQMSANLSGSNDEEMSVMAKEVATQPSFIEELLKRTEDLSENIVKLQMQIENQEKEFSARLQTETARAAEDAAAAARAEEKAKFDEQIAQLNAKFGSSFAKLDEAKNELENLYQKSEKEIAKTAVDIAKEVILKEVSDSSAGIASNIAKSLISELQDASKIEIKASPADFELISKNISQNSRIKITADDAISPGSVIVLSDIGNIDGTINVRFEKIKKILSE